MRRIDIYWELVSRMFSIASVAVSACLFAKFMKPFLNKKRYAWEAGGAYFSMMLITYFVPWELTGMFVDALGIMAAFTVMCLRDHNDRISHCSNGNADCYQIGYGSVRNIEQKIFLAAAMYLIEWFTHGLAICFRDILFRTILFSPSVLNKPEMVYLGFYAAVEAIYLTLRYLIMSVMFYMLGRAYVCKKETMDKRELGLMLTIPLSVLAGYLSFTFFFETYLSDMQQYIQELHLEYQWIKALYQLMSFMAILSSVVFYQKMKESYRREKERTVLEEQMESMKRHIEEVEDLYRDIRSLKHDMGNHVMILENLCQKDQQEAAGYLFNLMEEFQETTAEMKTGNPVTDVIIMGKEKEAKKKGILFTSDFHYPKGTSVNAFDVSIILNNALGNAIEGAAACESPYIKIRSYQEKNAYMIEIRNNFTGKLLFDPESGMPMTTKAGRENHGYGLANIRKVAQKYFGDIRIEQDGADFILHVMLMSE